MTHSLIKRPRGRPSRTIEQQEIENLKEYTDAQIFDLARPPARGRVAIKELIRRYELKKKELDTANEILEAYRNRGF